MARGCIDGAAVNLTTRGAVAPSSLAFFATWPCPKCGREIIEVRKPRYTGAARDIRALVVGLGLCLPLAGCASPDAMNRTADERLSERSSTVSAATWTDGPWPFTVEKGELTCIGPADDPGVFIVTDKGDIFALNPAAIRMADQVGAIADIDPIWRWRDPELPNTKVNVSSMILYALELC